MKKVQSLGVASERRTSFEKPSRSINDWTAPHFWRAAGIADKALAYASMNTTMTNIPNDPTTTVEAISSVQRRRRWSAAEKIRLDVVGTSRVRELENEFEP